MWTPQGRLQEATLRAGKEALPEREGRGTCGCGCTRLDMRMLWQQCAAFAQSAEWASRPGAPGLSECCHGVGVDRDGGA